MTDLYLDRGNDRQLSIDATVSLTGVDLAFRVARRRGGTVLLSSTASSGDAEGVATILLTGAETLLLPAPSVLAWDLEGVDGSGNRVTLAKGRLVVRDVVGVSEVVGGS